MNRQAYQELERSPPSVEPTEVSAEEERTSQQASEEKMERLEKENADRSEMQTKARVRRRASFFAWLVRLRPMWYDSTNNISEQRLH